MWTERERYLLDNDEISLYLEEKDSFHDYRVGNISYQGNQARITIEDDTPNRKLSDNKGLVWDFNFYDVECFTIESDCVVGFWIGEILVENEAFVFDCTNGAIIIKAKHVKLGIPKEDKF